MQVTSYTARGHAVNVSWCYQHYMGPNASQVSCGSEHTDPKTAAVLRREQSSLYIAQCLLLQRRDSASRSHYTSLRITYPKAPLHCAAMRALPCWAAHFGPDVCGMPTVEWCSFAKVSSTCIPVRRMTPLHQVAHQVARHSQCVYAMCMEECAWGAKLHHKGRTAKRRKVWGHLHARSQLGTATTA